MKSKKDIFIVITVYLVVGLLILILNDTFATIVFFVGLVLFHVFGFTGQKQKIFQDGQDSISRILSKLKQTFL